MAQLKDLLVSGSARVAGTLYASSITGTLSGNASSATYATSAGTATQAGKWTNAITLTIGSAGKSLQGTGNVSFTLAEIGAAAVWTGTLAQYNAISTKDNNTMYLIQG